MIGGFQLVAGLAPVVQVSIDSDDPTFRIEGAYLIDSSGKERELERITLRKGYIELIHYEKPQHTPVGYMVDKVPLV